MKTILIALVLIMFASVAQAATWTLTWINNDTYDGIDISRVVVQGNKCVWPAFVGAGTDPVDPSKFAAVSGTLTTFVDNTAPAGWLCYRARGFRTWDPGDGTPVTKNYTGFSNVDATKPGRITNIQVQPPQTP